MRHGIAYFTDGHTEDILELERLSDSEIEFKVKSGTYIMATFVYGVDGRFKTSEFYKIVEGDIWMDDFDKTPRIEKIEFADR